MIKIKYIISVSLLIWVISFCSCSDDSSEPTPTELEQQLEALLNEGSKWVLGNDGVLKDGFDVTSQFTDFKLTIGNKTYITENGADPVWPSSGNWDFENENPNRILRDGVTSISVSVVSENRITLIFMADGINSGGRTESVSGEYQFHLVGE